MKTQNEQTGMPSGGDFDNAGTESGEDQAMAKTENKANSPFLLGIGSRTSIGEMIMRWESSRFMI
jgi:hypothetical protein